MEVCPGFGTVLSVGGSSFDQVFKVILNMSTKEALAEEIKNAPENLLNEIYDYLLFLKKKAKEEKTLTHLASEKVLSRDWDSPEEDEAWKNL